MVTVEDAGLTLRQVRVDSGGVDADDLQAIKSLSEAADLAVLGVVELDAPEIAEMLLDTHTDREDTGLLMRGEQAVGFVWIFQDVTGRQSYSMIIVPPQDDAHAITTAAAHHLIRSATRCRDATGVGTWTLRCRQWLGEEPLGVSLREAGFAPVRQFHRMLVDSTSPAIPKEAPPVPEGVEFVVVRTEAERREAYLVENEAFADHWNHVPREWDEWWGFFESSPCFDEDGWWLLRVDGEPAAILMMADTLVDRNLGYVDLLAVRRPYRGRGLATFLLQRSFVRYRDMGRIGTQLGVDAESLTGAVALYERVGMRTVHTTQGWAIELD